MLLFRPDFNQSTSPAISGVHVEPRLGRVAVHLEGMDVRSRWSFKLAIARVLGRKESRVAALLREYSPAGTAPP